MRNVVLLLCLAFAAACGAPQQTASTTDAPAASSVEIRDAWASATPGGVAVAAGYMTIANPGAADELVSASSPRAARIEIHEMTMDGTVMRMRQVEGALAIPAGGDVTLGPGGLHLMFMDVTQPFVEGETVPVTLTFSGAGEVQVDLPVRAGGYSGH